MWFDDNFSQIKTTLFLFALVRDPDACKEKGVVLIRQMIVSKTVWAWYFKLSHFKLDRGRLWRHHAESRPNQHLHLQTDQLEAAMFWGLPLLWWRRDTEWSGGFEEERGHCSETWTEPSQQRLGLARWDQNGIKNLTVIFDLYIRKVYMGKR